jgi:hypothetical protein
MKPTQDEPPVTPPAVPATHDHDGGPSGTPPSAARPTQAPLPREIGGRDGPEPTRFGDWEKAGRCIDF